MQVGRNIKRPRSISSSSGSSSQASSSRSLSSTPPPKFHKPVQSTHTNQYTCNLPPTCSQPHTSTSYPTEEDLERHQETFHRWVCRTSVRNRNTHPQHQDPFAVPEGFIAGKWKECGKVFPEERYLSLHHTECHDPISREKQARGEKIFECFLPPDQCVKKFATPAKRRQHLIHKHHYPREYFFSITNHGINQIAQEDGLAISLIRPRKEISHPPGPHPQRKQPDLELSNPNLGIPPDPSTEVVMVEIEPTIPVKDVEMDDLVDTMGSSLRFVPRGLRRKGVK